MAGLFQPHNIISITGNGLPGAMHTYLGGHHLGIGATDLHPRIETGLVVGLHDITPVHLICSNPAVIGAWEEQGVTTQGKLRGATTAL